MSRRILATVACLLLLASMGASAAKATEIEIWYSLGAKYSAPLEVLIEKFNKSQSEVVVKGVYAGGYASTTEKLLAACVAGNPPALAQLEQMLAGQFVDNQQVIPLQQFIDKDKGININDYIPEILTAKKDGKIWGLPLNPSTLVMYYNKDLFRKVGLNPDKPPQTWDEVYQAAKKIKALGKDYYGIRLYAGDWVVEAAIWQFGGEIVSPDYKKILFNSKESVEAVTLWKKMVDEGLALYGAGREASDQDFAGRIGMTLRSSGSLETMKESCNYEVGVARLPYAKRRATAIGGANIYMFAGISKAQQEAAWKFIKYLTTAENQGSWAAGTGYMAARKSALESAEWKKLFAEDPRRQVTYTQLEYSRPRPLFAAYPEINKIIQDAFDAAIVGGKTPQAALAEAQKKAETALKDYDF